jgi:large repetitive protein
MNIMNTDNRFRFLRFVLSLLLTVTMGGLAQAAQKVGANCLTGGGTNCTAPIPDGSTGGISALNSTITIPAGTCPSVSRVCVATNIEHSSRGDLAVRLLHGATNHILVPANPADTEADISRAFVLETQFDGQNGAGTWSLSVTDSTNGGYGSLNNWTLGLCCGTGCGSGLVLVTPNGALQTTEAGGTASMNVELTCPTFNQVTIPVASSDTTEGTTPTPSLVFTAANSQNPQTLTFTGVNDALADGDIAYRAVLGTVAVGAPFATAVVPADLYNPPSVFQAVGNLPDVGLVNLDNEASKSLRISNASRAEGNSGNSGLAFTVTLSKVSATPVTVAYATANGSATTAGSDYTAASGTLTFSPGQTIKIVTVNARGDTALEPNETFVVNLSSPVGASIADAQGLGTILNDEGPVLRITDVTQGEGNSGTSAFTFRVTLTPSSGSPVTVNYATANGSATAGSDYTATSGALTFSAGQTTKLVSVNVPGDTALELNEVFALNLLSATGATIQDSLGVGTILNDEGPVLRISDVQQAERNSGTSTFLFTVALSQSSASPVTVNYATANYTAVAGSDYTAVPVLPLTFSPGQTSKTVVVNVTGDTVLEPNEAFTVNLSNATGATIFDGQGTGIILNDEGPVLRITDVERGEGNSGTTSFLFTVTLSQPSASPVTVNYATANESATAGSDYTAVPLLPLTFNPNETSKTVVVNVMGDTALEPNETFLVNLSSATGATILDNQGVGTILNDEGSVLRINNVEIVEGNSGTKNFSFTVTLTPISAGPVTVKYATADSTAVAGSDYTVTGGTLTFSAGQTSDSVVVSVRGDTAVEPNESFLVNLSDVTGDATIFDKQGIGTIANDDL